MLVVIFGPILFASAALTQSEPSIKITTVPRLGKQGILGGRVQHLGLERRFYEVVIVTFLDGKGWFSCHVPPASIHKDGHWATRFPASQEALDAGQIIAFVVPKYYELPCVSGAASIPNDFYAYQAGIAQVKRKITSLNLQVIRDGVVVSNLTITPVETSQRYTFAAPREQGSYFIEWTGSIVSKSPRINFVMEENISLQQHYIRDLFRGVVGTYRGLIYETNSLRHETSGAFRLTLTRSGAYSGTLLLAGKGYNFSDRFDTLGRSSVSIRRNGSQDLNFDPSLSVHSPDLGMSGTVGDGTWTSVLVGDRDLDPAANTGPSAFAGQYTLTFPGALNSTMLPEGDGLATVSINARNQLKMNASLADATSFTFATVISKRGQWPLYVPLYAGKGSIIARMQVIPTSGAPIEGRISWFKLPQENAHPYPAGFTNEIAARGSLYTPPASRASPLAFTNGIVALLGGDLDEVVTRKVTLGFPRLDDLQQEARIMTVNQRNGRFTGRVRDRNSSGEQRFKGVVLQNENAGYGFLLGTNLNGAVILHEIERPSHTKELHGLNFGPYVDGQDPTFESPITQAQIYRRLMTIRPHTQWIRTFGSSGGLEHVGRLAKTLGFKTALGAWLDRNSTLNEREISNVIQAGQQGNADVVIVGSETLLRGALSEAQLLSYISRVKAALPDVQVTTVEPYDQLLSRPDVIEAVDVIFANFYPYWQRIRCTNGVLALHVAYTWLTNAAASKQVVVAETGWPSAGNKFGMAIPSLANAAYYFQNFVSWTRANSVDYFYFEAFDETWKARYEGPQGASWGVFDKGGILKAGMERPLRGEVLPDNWTGREIPGGPGIPSIEFTFVPRYGTFDDLEGQILHVRPTDYKVVTYIYVSGWWIKPTFASPLTTVQVDGSFIVDVTTGGIDERATRYAAYLVPNGYNPPLLGGSGSIPSDVANSAIAQLVVDRRP